MAIAIMIDKSPNSTITDNGTAQEIPKLQNKNPADPHEWTYDTNLDIEIELSDEKQAINCICLFGASPGLFAAGVWIDNDSTAFGTGNLGFGTIAGKNNVVIISGSTGKATAGPYIQTIRVRIGLQNLYKAFTETTHKLGAVCIGMLEQFSINYNYGWSRSQSAKIVSMETIAGVRYNYDTNQHQRNAYSLSWDNTATRQDVDNMRRVYSDCRNGLDPIVLIPDVVDWHHDRVHYGYLPAEYSIVQSFLYQHGHTIEFVEAVQYEAP